MRYKLFYIVFAVSIVLYANYRLFWGLTLRHIMSLVMFVVCLSEEKKLFMDRWIGIYLIFILGFSISSIVTGYVKLMPRYLLGFYFVSYVAYWATTILIKKYNGIQLFASIFIVMGFVDAFVTIGQFYNIPYLTVIPSLMGINVDMAITEYLQSMDVGEEAFGMTLPGIMTTDVYNGYFLMTVGILSLSSLRNGIKLLEFFRLIPWFLFVFASYAVQQRGPFYLLILASAFILLKLTSNGRSNLKIVYIIILAIVIPIAFYLLFNNLLTGQSRYNIGFVGSSRESIYTHSIEFINDNFLLGGILKLFDTRGFAPHNLFLNAWIYGGLMGFISIVLLTWKQCVIVIKNLFNKMRFYNVYVFVISLAFICFTLNSMLHNVSIVTGDAIIWMLWAGFSAYISGGPIMKRVSYN